MNDEQLLRYSRHILLDELGIEGQERLCQSRALVIGVGGLGSPVALFLASAGVGHLVLVDHDTVDLTNLQRQIAHNMDRVGQAKAHSAQQAIHDLNPQVQVTPLVERANAELLDQQVPLAQVVLDCTDNFVTRQAINRACVQHKVPLVSGSAIRFDAQISVFDPRRSDSPCYACMFPPDHPPEETQCATLGVLAPLVGTIGSLQAVEAIKLLAGVGEGLVGRLLMLDALHMSWNTLNLKRDPHCPVCQPGLA
jgi:molybdopterin/thiamine biosynthesis adenylyltransferase